VRVGLPAEPIGDAALAPVLGARKDGRENAETSRSLLLTVLGELVRPGGGSAWTQSLVETMDLLGVGEKAARQAIGRLGERNWLRGDRVGRRTRWSFTPTLERLLDDGAERIYRFGHDQPRWDGRWLLVFASIPERRRQLRYQMTVGLSWAGFGSLAPAVWVSPWVDREPEAEQVLVELGVEGVTSFRSELGQFGDPHGVVARAWDLDTVRGHYGNFLAGLEDLGPSDPASTARDLVTLVHRWRRFPFLDPGLPRDLLPDGWPAAESADRFRTLHAGWRTESARWWAATEAKFAS